MITIFRTGVGAVLAVFFTSMVAYRLAKRFVNEGVINLSVTDIDEVNLYTLKLPSALLLDAQNAGR
ncbi:hypothetical protein [Paenibacillus sp. sgz500992]|uniref:hypothetical protein n=1 Tax=Paenibacillus sp. sgz500992 TaxID=3242476 RepID=UPI0036D2E84E